MQNNSTQQLIQTDDTIVLLDNRGDKRVLRICENRKFKWRKIPIELGELTKHPYGTSFEVVNGKLNKIDNVEVYSDSASEADEDGNFKTDNREIFTENETVQKLQHQQIEELKKTADPKSIIETIAENNKQFEKRTQYSKEKYMKRKKQKYLFTFTVLRANLILIADYFFAEEPKSIYHMRWDTLGLFLHLSGVGKNMLVLERTKGLVTGALTLRGAEHITLVHEQKKHPSKLLVYQKLNITEEQNQRVESKTMKEVMEHNTKYTHLCISGDFETKQILELIKDKLDNCCQVTVFSTTMETLTDVHAYMFDQRNYLGIRLTDTICRKYQVLKNRTHPTMTMYGFGGYILSAIKVDEAKS